MYVTYPQELQKKIMCLCAYAISVCMNNTAVKILIRKMLCTYRTFFRQFSKSELTGSDCKNILMFWKQMNRLTPRKGIQITLPPT